MTEEARPAYRPDIDGLRTVAIVPVVLYHAFPRLLTGGFVGVDVFFVISGYLITSLILKALLAGASGQSGFSFSSFYAHRIRRIFPALVLVLVACLVAGWYLLLADEYQQLGKETLAGGLFFENISLWGEAGYFDSQAELKPLLHLWSLGIEEQFYIAWPVFLVLAARWRLNALALTAVIAIASFTANVLLTGSHPVVAFYSPLTRMWELMAGGMLAYWHVRAGAVALPIARAHASSVVGLALILSAVLLIDGRTAFPGWWALLPTVGAALLIAAGPAAWVNRRLLASRPFVFVGLISYPLYLWHWPLLSFLRIVQGREPDLAWRLTAVALAVLLAWLTYVLLEKPLRARKRWTTTLALTCGVLLVSGAGLNIFNREGLEFRLKDSELQRVKFNISLQYQTQCRRDFKFAENAFCLRGSEAMPPTVALLGDSHAMTMYPGLGQYYAAHGGNLVHFGIGGGIPFYGVERMVNGEVTRYYAPLYAAILDYVTGDAHIKTVILMNRALREGPEGDVLRYQGAGGADSIAVYARAMADTLQKLLAAGKEVIVVMDNPELGFDPAGCIPRPPALAAARSPCAVPRAEYEAARRRYRDAVDAVLKRFPAVKRWDPAKYLCDDQWCRGMREGKMFYGRDGQHLTIAASNWLAERFQPE